MNQDQLYNLIQKLVVLASGGLIAKGIGDSSVWEGVGGAVAAFVTWAISHKWNATPPAVQSATSNSQNPPTPPMSMGGALHLLLIAGLCLGLGGCLNGCSTPQRAAYVTVGSVQVSAEAAMAAWNVYVGQYHPPVAVELKVKAAYEKYQAALEAVCDAGAVYAAAGVTNASGATGASAALAQAQADAAQDLADLVGLLKGLGVKL